MASTPSKLMTFAEFERLPNPPDGSRLELRHGEPNPVAPPKLDHTRVQWRIRRLLERAAADVGVVEKEIGFRVGEHNYRIADVAYVSKARWDVAADYFDGPPEIVVEVLSPSNTATELNEKEKLCLENGSLEFWLVDPDLKIVRVSTPDGCSITYRSGQSIPLAMFSGESIAVDEIFPA